MLSVLHVAAAAERGGLEVIMLNVVKGLDRSRFLPEVLFLRHGPFVDEVRDTGVTVHVIDAGRVREAIKGMRALRAIVRLIRDRDIGLVHTHDSQAHLYGGMAAFIAGVPSLLHLQGVPKPQVSRNGLVSLVSMTIPSSQAVACSEYVANAFHAAWPLRRRPLVVHSGIQPPDVSSMPDGTSVRLEYGIGKEAPLTVLLARLQRWKGAHIFVEAAAQMVREFPDARFLIVGGSLFGLEPAYADQLRRRVKEVGLEDALRFTGYKSDVLPYYAAADVVVHCSIEPDPFPTVLLEAMAMGKPVIASDCGGPREIVEHGVTGLLVEPGRPEILARSLSTLMHDADLRRRMGAAGRSRFASDFLASRMAREIERAYDLVVGLRGGTTRRGGGLP